MSVSRPSPSSAGTTRRGASTTTRSVPCAAPCAKTAARSPWPRPSPSDFMLQYRDHPHWSYQLHYDNLAALVKADPSLGPLRSYSTVKRYMQAHGLVRKPRLRPSDAPAKLTRETRRQTREIRSYEADVRRGRCGISISTMDRSRCSLPAASGCGRSRWASSTTTRDCAATSSGISRRPPRTWCTDSPRRSRNVVCRVRS